MTRDEDSDVAPSAPDYTPMKPIRAKTREQPQRIMPPTRRMQTSTRVP